MISVKMRENNHMKKHEYLYILIYKIIKVKKIK